MLFKLLKTLSHLAVVTERITVAKINTLNFLEAFYVFFICILEI